MWIQVESGEFSDSEIIVMLGENGTGKTTFIRMLAGMIPSEIIKDGNEDIEMPTFNAPLDPRKTHIEA